jgi:hypothetical protein
MIYLTYNNLDEETQSRLLVISKEDIESRYGKVLKAYAREHRLDYETLLEEEAQRNLYSYDYVFNI